mmetsp:Transcript_18149/g.28647  ORF Transcript_18149/g.28647 Transcript_18149/m.28647 type:complete len:246 (-) Transcript_18149:19-756(-)
MEEATAAKKKLNKSETDCSLDGMGKFPAHPSFAMAILLWEMHQGLRCRVVRCQAVTRAEARVMVPAAQQRLQRGFPGPAALDIIKVNTNIIVSTIAFHCKIHSSFIDAGIIRQLAILFQVSCFVCIISMYDITLVILVVSQPAKYNITRTNPDLLSHLASNMPQPVNTIITVKLTPSIPKHSHNLSVLLSIFLEFKLSFCLFIFILPPPSIFTTLSLILRHFSLLGFLSLAELASFSALLDNSND